MVPMHVQGGRQLDLAGCVPVDDSIQVWRYMRMLLSLCGMSAPPHQGVSLTPGGSP